MSIYKQVTATIGGGGEGGEEKSLVLFQNVDKASFRKTVSQYILGKFLCFPLFRVTYFWLACYGHLL